MLGAGGGQYPSSQQQVCELATMSHQALHTGVNCQTFAPLPVTRLSPVRLKAARARLAHKVLLASSVLVVFSAKPLLKHCWPCAGPTTRTFARKMYMQSRGSSRSTCSGSSNTKSKTASPARGPCRHQETNHHNCTCPDLQASLAENTETDSEP